jgi:hypothetical protein
MLQQWSGEMPSHLMLNRPRCAAAFKQYCPASTRSMVFAGVVAGAGGGGAPSQKSALPPQHMPNCSSLSSRLLTVWLFCEYRMEQFACVKSMYKTSLTSFATLWHVV